MPNDPEQRLKELEEQVRREQQARVIRGEQALGQVRQVPLATTPLPGSDASGSSRGKRLLSTTFGKVVALGGVIAAGAVTIWLVEKVFRIALYVGVAAAVAALTWYLFFRKK